MHQTCLITDEQLLHEFAVGKDHAAFGQLVDRHARWVFAASMRQLREHHLAEDAVQTVFILLAQKAATMNRRQKLSGWLFNAMQFTVKDLRRGAARRFRHEQTAARDAALRANSPSENSVLEIAELLDPAVARLPDRYRSAILLRFYQGMEFDEIAGDLTISESAARKRVDRAIEMLRNQLGENVDAPLLSAAALCGAEHATTAMIATATKAALAVHAGGSLTGSAAATVKGVGILMAAAKIQTAVIVGIAAVLIVIPAGIYIASPGSNHHPTTSVASVAPDPAVTEPIETMPLAPADSYALLPGQVLRRVADTHQQTRLDLLRPIAQNGGLNLADPPASIIVGFKDSQPQSWTWNLREPYMFPGLLEALLGATPQVIEGNATPFSVPGDFLFDQNSTAEQRCAALEQLLQNELKKPITLTYRDVQREVVVLEGTWKFTRAASPRSLGANIPTVELYEKKISKMAYTTEVGDPRRFASLLGEYVNQQVLIDAGGLPRELVWCDNDPLNRPHDQSAVLNHVTEQTGLTWSVQLRTVRRLFIEQKN